MPQFKLKNILELHSYMKILIDKCVELDEEGNYLINVAYMRVSTDRQAEQGYGLDIQEGQIMKYAKDNGFTNLVAFIDDGYTGTNMNRPAIKAIINLIKAFNDGRTKIRINFMVIPRIDRLARTMLGTLIFIQDYVVQKRDSKGSLVNNNRFDINFISTEEPYVNVDTNNPTNKLTLVMFAGLAEYDRDLIVKKLKDGRLLRVASGKWPGGGNLPKGYNYDKESGILVPNEEADKIKEAFRLFVDEHWPPLKISDRLGFKGERVVIQILKRKTYAGYILYNGQEFIGLHEPLITLQRWQEAQDEFERRSVGRNTKPDYLLAGLLVCGECGAKMRYQIWNNKTRECKIVCYSQQTTKKSLIKDENCDNEKYWQSEIEEAVISELFKYGKLLDPVKKEDKEGTTFDPVALLAEELKKEKRKLARLYDFDDDGDDDVLKDKIIESRRRIMSLTEQMEIEDAQKNITRRFNRTKNIFNNLEEGWDALSPKKKKDICRELIDRVVVYKNGTLDVHLRLESYMRKQ